MTRLSLITSGESHGEFLAAVIGGLPSGVPIDKERIDHELARRRMGFGRGGRMQIERDEIRITAGLWRGKTTGAPLQIILQNRDFKIDKMPDLLRPRPGHADLAGAVKYNESIRPILERSSARETAMRVAAGTVTRQLLEELDIHILAHVVQIGASEADSHDWSFERIGKAKRGSEMNCADTKAEKRFIAEIRRAIKAKDSLGGIFQVRAKGVPIGLGSCMEYTHKLDGRIARVMMGMQSVKSVGIGIGAEAAMLPGSKVHDGIFYSKANGFFRKTNHAGGIEGGMSNGEEIVVSVAMKPIATLRKALPSVNLRTLASERADFERSDVCAVPAGSVVGEAVLAFELADALLEKTGGDSLKEVRRNYQNYLKQVTSFHL